MGPTPEVIGAPPVGTPLSGNLGVCPRGLNGEILDGAGN